MPVAVHILPRYGLIYVRYEGVVRVEETDRAMTECRAHPNYDITFRHLVDFSEITRVDTDYVAIMALQARIAGDFLPPDRPSFLVYYAPTPVGQAAARMVMRSWEGVSDNVMVMLDDKADVLACLGLSHLPHDSFDALTDPAA